VRRSIYFRSLIDTRTVPYPSTNNRYLEKRCYALSYISKYRKQSTYDLINRTTNQLQQHLALHSNYIKIMKLLCRAKAIAIYGPFCKRHFAILYLKRYRLILVKKKHHRHSLFFSLLIILTTKPRLLAKRPISSIHQVSVHFIILVANPNTPYFLPHRLPDLLLETHSILHSNCSFCTSTKQ
jgi:hypothetical protein